MKKGNETKSGLPHIERPLVALECVLESEVVCYNESEVEYYYEDDFGYKEKRVGPLDNLSDKMFIHVEDLISNENNIKLFKFSVCFGVLAVCVGVVGVNSCQAEMMRSRVGSTQKGNREWLKPVAEVAESKLSKKIKSRLTGRKRRLGGFLESMKGQILLKVFESQESQKTLKVIPVSVLDLISIPVEKLLDLTAEKVTPKLPLALTRQGQRVLGTFPTFPVLPVFPLMDVTPQKVSPVLNLSLAARRRVTERVAIYPKGDLLKKSSSLSNIVFPSWGSLILSACLSLRVGNYLIVPPPPPPPASPVEGDILDKVLLSLWDRLPLPPGTRRIVSVLNQAVKGIKNFKKIQEILSNLPPPGVPVTPAPGTPVTPAPGGQYSPGAPEDASGSVPSQSPNGYLPDMRLTAVLAAVVGFLNKERLGFRRREEHPEVVLQEPTFAERMGTFIVVNRFPVTAAAVGVVVVVYLNREKVFSSVPRHVHLGNLLYQFGSNMFADYGAVMKSTTEVAQKFGQSAYEYILSNHAKEIHWCNVQAAELSLARQEIKNVENKLVDALRLGDKNLREGQQCQKDFATARTDDLAFKEHIRIHYPRNCVVAKDVVHIPPTFDRDATFKQEHGKMQESYELKDVPLEPSVPLVPSFEFDMRLKDILENAPKPISGTKDIALLPELKDAPLLRKSRNFLNLSPVAEKEMGNRRDEARKQQKELKRKKDSK